jgi:hypothetical protein
LEQKKRELLKKYLTDEFMESAEETNGKWKIHWFNTQHNIVLV